MNVLSKVRVAVASCLGALIASFANNAFADVAPAPWPQWPPSDSGAQREDPWASVSRPWLYAPDPTAPPPGHLLTSMALGYAQIDRGAARPFAADVAHGGAVYGLGAEVGVSRFASIQAEALFSGQGPNNTVSAGTMLGVAFYPLPAKGPVALSLSGGYLRELGGGNGVWSRAAAATDLGPVRVIVTALGSHVFQPRRDSVDLLMTAGASVAVAPAVRLGVEYVVQDLEGAFDDEEADGGVRHFIGPTVSFKLASHVHILGGPAFGLSKGAPGVLGRLAAAYAF